jgi:hypothetical protein
MSGRDGGDKTTDRPHRRDDGGAGRSAVAAREVAGSRAEVAQLLAQDRFGVALLVQVQVTVARG